MRTSTALFIFQFHIAPCILHQIVLDIAKIIVDISFQIENTSGMVSENLATQSIIELSHVANDFAHTIDCEARFASNCNTHGK